MQEIKLNNISDIDGSRYKAKKKGRGIGSSKGKTCGRGVKGQKSRSGVSIKTEGGQMPLIKRLPKRGFNSINKKEYQIVNLEDIDKALVKKKFDIKSEINNELLLKIGLIRKLAKPVKILCRNTETFAHQVKVNVSALSANAKKVLNIS